MDAPKDSLDCKIQEAITKAYSHLCKDYKGTYLRAVEAYSGPHKTLGDFEKAIGTVDALVQEVHGVSDSCISDVDIGLMVLYHGIRSKKEQRVINEKRKEMKNWPLPFVEADVKEALKSIAEAKKRKSLNEQAVDYYIGDDSG
jgi:hypothetical protein